MPSFDYFLRPEFGILGVLVFLLLGVLVWQQKRMDKKDELIADLQEKRKNDTDSYTKSYTDLARESIGISKDTTNTLNLLQRSIDSLTTSLQAVMNRRENTT